MPDSTRPLSADRPEPGPDRDATIESLLVAGLDSYFKAEYDRAIHAWTRVLFLDRNHARARAYIDRARAILAERQRESDELLHAALSAFDRGETAEAKELLDEALARGANEAQALALRDRLERLEGPAAVPSLAVPATRPPKRAVEPVDEGRASRIVLVRDGRVSRGGRGPGPRLAAFRRLGGQGSRPAARRVSPPDRMSSRPCRRPRTWRSSVPTALFGRGHLHEALSLLDDVGVGDRRRADADRLRAEIQTDAACRCRAAHRAPSLRARRVAMKCPKCQYISFDSPDRCRNCGYDFSLASGSVSPVDPVLQRGGDADGPWPDLSLKDGASAPSVDTDAVVGTHPAPTIEVSNRPARPAAVQRARPRTRRHAPDLGAIGPTRPVGRAEGHAGSLARAAAVEPGGPAAARVRPNAGRTPTCQRAR